MYQTSDEALHFSQGSHPVFGFPYHYAAILSGTDFRFHLKQMTLLRPERPQHLNFGLLKFIGSL